MPNNTQPIRILIADDQETDAFFIEQAFGQLETANEIHIVKDGQEVVEYLRREGAFAGVSRPHLIIMDIKMPRQDGIETLGIIKGDPGLASIPVIMMSGSKAPDDITRAYAIHANAYVPKSNGFEDMLRFVRALESFWFLEALLPQETP